MYYFLSALQEQVVGALTTTLPEPDPNAVPPQWPPAGAEGPPAGAEGPSDGLSDGPADFGPAS